MEGEKGEKMKEICRLKLSKNVKFINWHFRKIINLTWIFSKN